MSEKLEMMSSNIIQENIDYIANRFPNTLKEVMENGKLVKRIDFDVLKQELSTVVIDDKQERYQMTWPDKKKSILLANSRINATLRPIKEKSVDFDNTKNLYIEGDNLDVLKLLRETYLGKVKMILIDPPYNTGNDFVYADNFSESIDEYLVRSGQYDDLGNRMFQNNETSGRYHTTWLNMIYPRLKIAKDLLSDEGIILIHIDENEYVNLIKICDEIFGHINYIENFIWIKNSTKNLSKTTSTNHEYVICYCKNRKALESTGLLRIDKPGLSEVRSILKQATKEKWTFEKTEQQLKQFYKSHPDLKGISMYDHVDSGPSNKVEEKCYQVYTLSDISAPKSTGKAATYEILHPITGRPCKSPTRGWAYTRSTMEQHIKNNLIYFYEDENNVPRFKRYLDTVTTEVIKSTFEDFNEGKKDLLKLFDGRCPFDNPKPVSVEKRFINLLKDNDIVLDFFSGSGTTAHAVFEVNSLRGSNIRFIAIQVKEICDVKSEAYDMGFKYLTDLSEERIRRSGEKIKKELIKEEDKCRLTDDKTVNSTTLDFGFRVLKLDSSNMNDVYYNPKSFAQSLLDDVVENIKSDRTSLDLLFQVMLELGLELSSKIEEKEISGKKYYLVNDNDLIACFDEDLNNDVLIEIAKLQPLYAVFKDKSFSNDSVGINNEQIFKTYSQGTKIRVL